MTIWIILLAVGWAVCAVINYGATVGYFQNEFKGLAGEGRVSLVLHALVNAAAGPMGLAGIALSRGFKHGLQWRLYPLEQCRQFHQERYPGLRVPY